jgi:aspartate/methionine/tyrosine aminotransferase
MDVWSAAGERQRTHGDLVNLSAGQPSTPAPAAVRAAAAKALDTEVLGYTVALGIPPLRAAIAGHYGRTYGLDVAPEDVVVTTGSSGGFLLAFLAAFDAGDRVAMARPGYPCYRNILTALDCEVVELACGPETRYQPTVAMMEALDEPVKGLVVASPANPTGTVLDPAELAALATWCAANGVQLISDEIYHGIAYAGAPEPSCAWATSREAIVVNSFSKYFSMTGWRLGWLCCRPGCSGRPTASRATSPCARPPCRRWPRWPRSTSRATPRPTGTWPATRSTATCSSTADAPRHHPPRARRRRLLRLRRRRAPHARLDGPRVPAPGRRRAGRRPGLDFDPVEGHRFIRFSCAGSAAEVREALARLERWLGSYAAPHAPPNG